MSRVFLLENRLNEIISRQGFAALTGGIPMGDRRHGIVTLNEYRGGLELQHTYPFVITLSIQSIFYCVFFVLSPFLHSLWHKNNSPTTLTGIFG
jgi:hypothetical protein